MIDLPSSCAVGAARNTCWAARTRLEGRECSLRLPSFVVHLFRGIAPASSRGTSRVLAVPTVATSSPEATVTQQICMADESMGIGESQCALPHIGMIM